MDPRNIKKIYLIAICGTGMASLAGLLKEAGYEVTGSDSNIYPPMSTLLADLGIPVKAGYTRGNITPDIDLVIVGNAVSKTNEEVQEVLQRQLPYTSFPAAIQRFFLGGRKSLVVAGTHGKTTTTALLSWVLHDCGQNPGFMVGGWLKNFDRNYRVPGGDVFVTEGDEYDTAFFDKGPKFLHYRPHAAILTGVEFDHADIYRDLEHFKSSFRKFVEIIDPQGCLLVRSPDPHAESVLGGVSCVVERYGFSAESDWAAAHYRQENGTGLFTLRHQGKDVGEIRLPMIGRHNAEKRRGGGGARHPSRNPCRTGVCGVFRIPRHQAPSGDRRREKRRRGDRRFCPSSHGHRSDDRGGEGGVSRAPGLGGVRAAFGHLPQERVSGSASRKPGSGGRGGHRGPVRSGKNSRSRAPRSGKSGERHPGPGDRRPTPPRGVGDRQPHCRKTTGRKMWCW